MAAQQQQPQPLPAKEEKRKPFAFDEASVLRMPPPEEVQEAVRVQANGMRVRSR